MLLTKRNGITPTQRESAAQAAVQLFLGTSLFLNNHRLACYFAQDNEFDCTPIIKAAWHAKKNCFLPVLSNSPHCSLSFASYHPHDTLYLNRYNILEPENKTVLSSKDLDLVVVPLVGFDLQGNRLGMGGGYYDRTFAFLREKTEKTKTNKPYLIGLAYECQYVPEIPEEEYDIPLGAVLTEKKLYTFMKR